NYSLLHFTQLFNTYYIKPYLSLFFTAPATTEIYTLSLHDALPISTIARSQKAGQERPWLWQVRDFETESCPPDRMLFSCNIFIRSEEHTSELQSRENLVCRLLLEKKNDKHPILSDIKLTCL